MSKLITALSVLTFAFTVFTNDVAQAAKADGKQLTPHQIIGQLRARITSIGQGKAKPADFKIATTAALDGLQAFIAKGDNLELLTIKDEWGKTPLNLAAYMGYSEILAELLAHPSAKLTLNEPDDTGISPWTYANFAPRQSAFACNPKILLSPFSWATLHMNQPYYTQLNPYPKVRKQLEDAGATHDMAKAKQMWHKICKFQSNETRDAVTQSLDLQQSAIIAGGQALKTFLDKLQGR